MTREEAIAILRSLKDRNVKCLELIRRYPYPNRLMLTTQAIYMAIEALKGADGDLFAETPTVSEKHQLSEETPTNAPTDLISRQAAIDALAKEMPSLTTPDGSGEFDHDIQITDEAFVDCMQIINELPSAEPKTGEWVNREKCQVDEDAYEVATCSECRAEITIEYPYDSYCPNCGARMTPYKGGDDE